MSDTHNKLQNEFKNLPDAQPPFGHDTRIKALAREHLQSQRDDRARTKRWAGGLATLASAALVFLIAAPLLQKPITLESVEELSDAIASEQMIIEDAASAVEPAIRHEITPQKSSAGGGSEAIELDRAESAQIVLPRAKILAEPLANDEADNLVGRATKSFSGAQLKSEDVESPTLESLLAKLEQAEKKSNLEKAKQIRDEITRLFPDYINNKK